MARYDVVVIGGGINGAGVAQAAAASGYKVLLLEQTGLASGTSSKSSKLIHGGLRYLESFEFNLVRESLRERELLLKLAPDLVKLQRFLIPVYSGMRRGSLLLRTGLGLYYTLSGFSRDARFGTVPSEEWQHLNGLRTKGLSKVFFYNDARTDDAELTRAVMRSAQSLGAELVCPAEFRNAEVHSDGVDVQYRAGGAEQSCRASVVVNAGGPWVNLIAERISPRPGIVSVELVQGTHIEIAESLGKEFYYLESPRDGRAVFVMPREGRTIIGTTETRYRADPAKVAPLPAEETYLLGVLGHYFPDLKYRRRDDISTSWAGLRVLPSGDGHAFHRSRETVLKTDKVEQPRVLSIYGGKLTSYRVTAEKVLVTLLPTLPARKSIARTSELPLSPE